MDNLEGLQKQMQEDAFRIYQQNLEWIDRRLDPQTAEFYGETPETWKHAKEVAFSMYQDLRCLLGPTPRLSGHLNREKCEGIPPYTFEGNPTEFPCVGVLEYRGHEYPVYNDDYGMSWFAVVDGRSIQVDSFGGETDWYFELDRIIDRIYDYGRQGD